MFLSPSLALRESQNQSATDVCFIQSCTLVDLSLTFCFWRTDDCQLCYLQII